MITILFYVFLFAFWVESVLGLKLTNIKGVSFSNTVMYIFIIVWVWQLIRSKRMITPHPASLYLALFLATVVISTIIMVLVGMVPYVSLSRAFISIKSWADPLILFYIFYNIISSEKECYNFINALTLFLVVIALSVLMGTFGYLDFDWLPFGATERASGFGNPNDYASYLVLFIPLFLVKFFLLNNNVWKFFGVCTLLLLSSGIIITGSRGGILGALFAVLIFFLLLKREVRFRFPLVVFIISGCCVLLTLSFLIAPQQVREDLQERVLPESSQDLDKYSAGRLSRWNNTFKLFVKRPLVGHGHKSMKPLAEKYFYSDAVGHNLYLSYLAQYGLVGLTLFLIALVKILSYVKRSYSVSQNLTNRLLYLSYSSGVAGFLFSLIFVDGGGAHYFFWVYSAVMSKMSYFELRAFANKKDVLTCDHSGSVKV